jgi:hypothetical protein
MVWRRAPVRDLAIAALRANRVNSRLARGAAFARTPTGGRLDVAPAHPQGVPGGWASAATTPRVRTLGHDTSLRLPGSTCVK